jgi:hypothetical protein
MAQLIIRANGADAALLTRLLEDRPGMPVHAARSRPSRLVVDAPTAASHPEIAVAARRAGLPMLIDPQTFYLQDYQHSDDPWARLPFADPAVATVADLRSDARTDRLVATSLEYQLARGASMLIAPYVHVDCSSDGWAEVQAGLYRRTRRYLDHQQLRLPVLAPVAVSWRLVGRPTWPSAMDGIVGGLRELRPDEVALAASRVDQGKQPEERLVDLYAAIGLLRRDWPVIAWHQGVLGEACVAAGALGYETGIGWRERCDLSSQMSRHRKPHDGDFGPRAVYVTALGRSIPKRTVAVVINDPTIGPDLVCLDPACCPAGRQALLGDARVHALIARSARLAVLAGAQHPRWAWQHLAHQAAAGLNIAERVNTRVAQSGRGVGVDTTALRAIAITADARRQTAVRTHAA